MCTEVTPRLASPQIYGSVAVTPFSVKGLIGTLSDAVPFLGYHKNSYIVAVALLGSLR